jgi:hypothetical protein
MVEELIISGAMKNFKNNMRFISQELEELKNNF